MVTKKGSGRHSGQIAARPGFGNGAQQHDARPGSVLAGRHRDIDILQAKCGFRLGHFWRQARAARKGRDHLSIFASRLPCPRNSGICPKRIHIFLSRFGIFEHDGGSGAGSENLCLFPHALDLLLAVEPLLIDSHKHPCREQQGRSRQPHRLVERTPATPALMAGSAASRHGPGFRMRTDDDPVSAFAAALSPVVETHMAIGVDQETDDATRFQAGIGHS